MKFSGIYFTYPNYLKYFTLPPVSVENLEAKFLFIFAILTYIFETVPLWMRLNEKIMILEALFWREYGNFQMPDLPADTFCSHRPHLPPDRLLRPQRYPQPMPHNNNYSDWRTTMEAEEEWGNKGCQRRRITCPERWRKCSGQTGILSRILNKGTVDVGEFTIIKTDTLIATCLMQIHLLASEIFGMFPTLSYFTDKN